MEETLYENIWIMLAEIKYNCEKYKSIAVHAGDPKRLLIGFFDIDIEKQYNIRITKIVSRTGLTLPINASKEIQKSLYELIKSKEGKIFLGEILNGKHSDSNISIYLDKLKSLKVFW